MRIIPLSEIAAMADKEQISGVKGTIKSIFKSKSGTTAQGKDWAVQDFDLTDNQVTIKVKVWNHPPIPTTAKGSAVTLLSHSGEKGLSGLYAHDDEYNGKVTRQIKVTDTGEVVLGAGSAPAAAQWQAPAAPEDEPPGFAEPHQARTRTDAPRAPALTPAQQQADDLKKGWHALLRLGNMFLINMGQAEWIAAQHKAKYPSRVLTSDNICSIAATLTIGGERQGVQNLMPDHPVDAAPKAEGGK